MPTGSSTMPETVDAPTDPAPADLLGTAGAVEHAVNQHARLNGAVKATSRVVVGPTWKNLCSDEFAGGFLLGAADNLAAWQAAHNSVPAGGMGFFRCPPGVYNFAGTPKIQDRNIRVVAAGGIGNHGQGGTNAPDPAQTIWKPTGNFRAFEFSETDYADTESRYSSLEHLCFVGTNNVAHTNQCVFVNNRGVNLRYVTMIQLGAEGLFIQDCDVGLFEYIVTYQCKSAGQRWDPTAGLGGSQNGSVTANTFVSCISAYNGGAGVSSSGDAWGHLWLGGVVEGNTGYGVDLQGTATSWARSHIFLGLWDEINTAGSVRALSTAHSNFIWFLRYSSGEPVGVGTNADNVFWGPNIGAANTKLQRNKMMVGTLLSAGGIGADTDQLYLRNSANNADANLRARALALTFGMGGAAAFDAETGSLAIPQFVDAINLPVNRGATARNAGNTANVPLWYLDGSDEFQLGPGLAAGKRLILGGPIQLPNQAPTTLADGGIWWDGTNYKGRKAGATITIA